MIENKKYFIGMTFSKKVNDLAELIAQDLYDTFRIRNTLRKYPPHITLKTPFAGFHSNKDEIVELLEKFFKGRPPISVEIQGFGHFIIGVIYCDILQHDTTLTDLQADLCEVLQELSWTIHFDDAEPNGKSHITIGKDGIRGRFPSIFGYLMDKYSYSFSEILDTVCLFEKKPNCYTWNVSYTIKLR